MTAADTEQNLSTAEAPSARQIAGTGQTVLGIDTSTEVCVGIARAGVVLATAIVADRMQHVEQLTPLVRGALGDAGLTLDEVEQVVVGLGPGPFTGLRVGVATARMLASVRRLPLHGVCSLDVLAQQWVRAGAEVPAEFLVGTDARRKEVYWARYDASGSRLEGPKVGVPETLPDLPLVGPAADLYSDRVRASEGPRSFDPGVLAVVAADLVDAGVEPLYLRRPDAAEPGRRKSVLVHRPWAAHRLGGAS
ncbi:tRNA (adenosine(37)-N6)-threonylcarbamoyltransferase complex dimerization subunit type 1 TsaB [Microlunatus panaciterrae]|nr:tRNA (adenosine(37)-N6)-threonylcarbamoyltransferase complex dimerization subunit type 1 TsaB [Microlunatus panaciterrae]